MRPTYDEKGEVVKDRKGNVVYDKATKDKEIVPYKESIEDYMSREVLPHIPDAKAFFLEDLGAKKPIIKTGAEFPFTRYFYKYEEPEPSEKILAELAQLDAEIAVEFRALTATTATTGTNGTNETAETGVAEVSSVAVVSSPTRLKARAS